jgi:hypothetical protein
MARRITELAAAAQVNELRPRENNHREISHRKTPLNQNFYVARLNDDDPTKSTQAQANAHKKRVLQNVPYISCSVSVSVFLVSLSVSVPYRTIRII